VFLVVDRVYARKKYLTIKLGFIEVQRLESSAMIVFFCNFFCVGAHGNPNSTLLKYEGHIQNLYLSVGLMELFICKNTVEKLLLNLLGHGG